MWRQSTDLHASVTSPVNTSEPVPLAALHEHAITLPPLCLTHDVVPLDHELLLHLTILNSSNRSEFDLPALESYQCFLLFLRMSFSSATVHHMEREIQNQYSSNFIQDASDLVLALLSSSLPYWFLPAKTVWRNEPCKQSELYPVINVPSNSPNTDSGQLQYVSIILQEDNVPLDNPWPQSCTLVFSSKERKRTTTYVVSYWACAFVDSALPDTTTRPYCFASCALNTLWPWGKNTSVLNSSHRPSGCAEVHSVWQIKLLLSDMFVYFPLVSLSH